MAFQVLAQDSTPASVEDFKARIAQAEAGASEGMLLELTIQYHGIPGADTVYEAAAASVNRDFLAGTLMVDGEPVQAWPGETAVAFIDTAQNVVIIRAVKTIPPLLIILGVFLAVLLAAIAIWTIYYWVVQGEISVPPILELPGLPPIFPPGGGGILNTVRLVAIVIGIVVVVPPLLRLMSAEEPRR